MYSFKIGSIDREIIPDPSFTLRHKITACIDSAVDLVNMKRLAVWS